MRWILWPLLLKVTLVFSATSIIGEGRFRSTNNDSHEFIKKQLIFEGIKDMVSKKLESLNLNKEIFWMKYSEGLNSQLSKIEENLKSKYNFQELDDARKKERIIEQIRERQLVYERGYLGLDKLLKKFSIRKISRSQQNPNYRYIKLEGVIDGSSLTKTYYQLTAGERQSEFGTLFVKSSFVLQSTTYSELGIENEKDLRVEVTKNWVDWLYKNKPMNISKVEMLDSDKSEELETLMARPVSEYKENIPVEFKRSLLLEIQVTVEKEKYDDRIKQYKFSYSGNAYLKDIEANIVIGTYSFGEQNKTYNKLPNFNLANILANHIYQMGKRSLPYIKNSMKEMNTLTKTKALNLYDFESIYQVHNFLKLAESKGIKFSLKTELDSFGKNKAQALLHFQGDFLELKQVISSLQAAKKDLSYEVIDVDSQLGIKFNKVIENI